MMPGGKDPDDYIKQKGKDALITVKRKRNNSIFYLEPSSKQDRSK